MKCRLTSVERVFNLHPMYATGKAGSMTTNTKHTPGPWRTNGNTVSCAPQPNGKHTVALTFSTPDAALVAAAPDLLAALEWALGYLPTEGQSVTWMRGHAQARAAIARARGDK